MRTTMVTHDLYHFAILHFGLQTAFAFSCLFACIASAVRGQACKFVILLLMPCFLVAAVVISTNKVRLRNVSRRMLAKHCVRVPMSRLMVLATKQTPCCYTCLLRFCCIMAFKTECASTFFLLLAWRENMLQPRFRKKHAPTEIINQSHFQSKFPQKIVISINLFNVLVAHPTSY